MSTIKKSDLFKYEEKIRETKAKIRLLNIELMKPDSESWEYAVIRKWNRDVYCGRRLLNLEISRMQKKLDHIRGLVRFIYIYNRKRKVINNNLFQSELNHIMRGWKKCGGNFLEYKYTPLKLEKLIKKNEYDTLFFIVNTLRKTIENYKEGDKDCHSVNNDTIKFLNRYEIKWW